MKVAFIGCVQFSYSALTLLLKDSNVEICGIITRKASSFNTDFADVGGLGEENNIPILYVDGGPKDAQGQFLRDINPDIIYCFGWSYLLPQEILDIPPMGVVGFHPAALPKNRGRHPLIWALVLGLEETGVTFFMMDEGADSGPIVSQEIIPIAAEDAAESLYEKVTTAALSQISGFTKSFAKGTMTPVPQDHSQSSYWRKRSRVDGKIDWRMSAKSIHDLVRALTRPYPGAETSYGEQNICIWKVRVSQEENPNIANIEPGKVLDVDQNIISVKCGNGVIQILEHDFDPLPNQGEYL